MTNCKYNHDQIDHLLKLMERLDPIVTVEDGELYTRLVTSACFVCGEKPKIVRSWALGDFSNQDPVNVFIDGVEYHWDGTYCVVEATDGDTVPEAEESNEEGENTMRKYVDHHIVSKAFETLKFDVIVGLDAVHDEKADGIREEARNVLSNFGLRADKTWERKVIDRYENRPLGTKIRFIDRVLHSRVQDEELPF